MIAGQLTLDDDLPAAERQAIAADFLEQQRKLRGARRAHCCNCPSPLPLADEWGEETCAWCGREPRTNGRGGPNG